MSVPGGRHDHCDAHRFYGLQSVGRRSYRGAFGADDDPDANLAEDIIEIEILGNDDSGQLAVFDGWEAVNLKVADRLRVERSPVETVMVKLHEVSFVDNLRSKLAE